MCPRNCEDDEDCLCSVCSEKCYGCKGSKETAPMGKCIYFEPEYTMDILTAITKIKSFYKDKEISVCINITPFYMSDDLPLFRKHFSRKLKNAKSKIEFEIEFSNYMNDCIMVDRETYERMIEDGVL